MAPGKFALQFVDEQREREEEDLVGRSCFLSVGSLLASKGKVAGSAASSQGGGVRRAPRITEQPVDVVVRKHEPVTLRCSADGEPAPRIAWFHDGKSVRDSATRMVLPEGQLFFLQVQHSRREQDTGLYWCTATNALGTARSRNASVELA
ncbi:hypothetical protein MTO96_033887, partial [Rhipicephalus appendiculatus]